MAFLRPCSALLSLMVAVPLVAQAPAQQSPSPDLVAAKPAAAAPAGQDTAVTWVEVGSHNGDLRGKLHELLLAQVAKARAKGLTPFMEFGATWCGPCQALEASLHNKDVVDAFSGAYVIHIDANEWDTDDELVPLGFKGGGMPILMAMDKNARITGQLNGAWDGGNPAKIKSYVQAHLWKAESKLAKVAAR